MEKLITLDTTLMLGVYGNNEVNLDLLSHIFPKIKLTARGDVLKIVGEESELEHFITRFQALVDHYEKYNQLSETDILNIISTDNATFHLLDKGDGNQEVIVYGRDGRVIKAITPNQKKMVATAQKNDMIFAIGPAGTGKTYTAVALAVQALKSKQIRRIILTRPAVEAGENLGFLPGDLKDKLDPYLQPLYDALWDMMPMQKLLSYVEEKTIEIAPLAFMRGRTLDNAFVILDEAQNATESQIKMFLTRMGKNAKFFITGDVSQIDLPRHQKSGLVQATKILKGIKGIDFVYMDTSDVVRHRLVTKIIQRYDELLDKKEAENKATEIKKGE